MKKRQLLWDTFRPNMTKQLEEANDALEKATYNLHEHFEDAMQSVVVEVIEETLTDCFPTIQRKGNGQWELYVWDSTLERKFKFDTRLFIREAMEDFDSPEQITEKADSLRRLITKHETALKREAEARHKKDQ